MMIAIARGHRWETKRWEVGTPKRLSGLKIALFFAFFALALWPIGARADEPGVAPNYRPAPARRACPLSNGESGACFLHVTVPLHKSRTLKVEEPFASAVVGSPQIVDAMPVSDTLLYIQGKTFGTTNVSLFDRDMRLMAVVDVEVVVDTADLQHAISTMADGRGIRVRGNNDQVVLTGVAQNAVVADRVVNLAKSLSPDGSKIVNAMTVAPSQQVMLRVRFLEVSRQAGREIGVSWFQGNKAGNRGINSGTGLTLPLGRDAVGGVSSTGEPVTNAPGLPLFGTASTLLSGASPFGVFLASLANKNFSLDVALSALETKGLVRRLAEPDLVALSGDTASFLAGGEFPVITTQPGSVGANAVITTQYQPFGVQLTFVPTVLSDGIINLRLAPSVSELDFAQAITASGFVIPSLIKREAKTTIELRDGQSFAIAGLLSSQNRRAVSQLPWVGSVPVLGALFRSASFQQEQTDLVVIITPHLVAPAAPGQKLASPLDDHIPTNDVDFFLMGQMEQKKKFREYVTSGGGIQGPYGHIISSGPGSPVLSVNN